MMTLLWILGFIGLAWVLGYIRASRWLWTAPVPLSGWVSLRAVLTPVGGRLLPRRSGGGRADPQLRCGLISDPLLNWLAK
jgi:hypothetical protein